MAASLSAHAGLARPNTRSTRLFSRKLSVQTHLRLSRKTVLQPAKATDETVSVEGREDGVRCFINEEGHLVCERLEPGDYVVKAAAPRAETSVPDTTGQIRPDGKITYCYVLENGALVCEGLTPGEYKLRKAQDGDMEDMVKHMANLAAGKADEVVSEVKEESKGIFGKIKSLLGSE